MPGWRRPALKKAEEWLVAHVEGSDGLGAIFPAMVDAVIAFRCLGYEESHPLVQGQLRELERFEIEEAGEMRLQPCFSPVWDTALSAGALLAADMDGNEAPIQDALAWLLEREITVGGDWREKSLQDAPGGWCFEYRNDLYPTATTRRKSCWYWPRSGAGPTSWKRGDRPRRRAGSAGSLVFRSRTEAGPRSTAAATRRS